MSGNADTWRISRFDQRSIDELFPTQKHFQLARVILRQTAALAMIFSRNVYGITLRHEMSAIGCLQCRNTWGGVVVGSIGLLILLVSGALAAFTISDDDDTSAAGTPTSDDTDEELDPISM